MGKLKAIFEKYIFHFNFPGGTSRGVLTTKQSWFLKLWHEDNPECKGIGEISILPGLSPETPKIIEDVLSKILSDPIYFESNIHKAFKGLPALKFGFETALLDLNKNGKQILFPSDFTEGKAGIHINGLIWMGDKELMLSRINEKLEQGFRCLKLKVGAINFKDELDLLKEIRKNFSPNALELRVDANGAFKPETALNKLNDLAQFNIHSIEQPIQAGQWNNMAILAKKSPIPIALDEELISIEDEQQQMRLLDTINPQYVIFKPSLLGGLAITNKWRFLAESRDIKWWVTSALEGNIGLNAIAQWTFLQNSKMPQGLGTGQVFTNNIVSPLHIKKDSLYFNPNHSFQL